MITPATSLTAKFVTDKEKETRGTSLDWSASSTVDIDGYKVFRSIKRNSGFKKIGQTDEITFEFFDDSVSASTTYYYVVRAFQTNLQSASSNVASITTPEGIGLAKVVNVKITDYTQNSMLVTWDASEEENLTGYIVSAQIATGSKLTTFNVEKSVSSFRLYSLEAGEIYKISVQAKDNTDTLSLASTVYQHTLSWDYAGYFETSIWTTVLTGLASLLTIVLIWLMTKKNLRRKRKILID